MTPNIFNPSNMTMHKLKYNKYESLDLIKNILHMYNDVMNAQHSVGYLFTP